jgi:hypothetical protein
MVKRYTPQKRDYEREYRRKRYNTDSKFREQIKERSRKWMKEHYEERKMRKLHG